MLRIQTDKIGDMAVVECEGRIEKEHSAKRLYDIVVSHEEARIIVLDLSEVYDMAAVGIDTLVSLQQWAFDHDVQLKLFNPSRSLRFRLQRAKGSPDFDIAPLPEMMVLLSQADSRYALHPHGNEAAH
jgi:anti-anti-sigma regulatory factor